MDDEFRVNGQVDPRMRFLIIDDSVTMRRIIANILVRLGYPDVVHAANGREALERLGAEAVDVVITDWYMPEMNGLDFVKILRTTPATSHIPIVIVTANAASNDIQHALELGVKGYILKPFTVETMKDKIDALMAQLGQDARPASETRQEAPSPVEAPPEHVAAAEPAEAEPLSEPEPDFDTPPELGADSGEELAAAAPPELAADAARSPEPGPEVVA
jgi:two-component system, chemotaxis family, chemotaxis protein CheY